MTTASEAPICLNCGKRLRRYRYRGEKWGEGKEWGDYGDGIFCGLRCGYAWACAYLGWKPDVLLSLRVSMERLMESKKKLAAGPSEKEKEP